MGNVTDKKLNTLRNGMFIQGIKYKGMKVYMEVNGDNRIKNKRNSKKSNIKKTLTKRNRKKTNQWLHITCDEGKNRQIRKMLGEVKMDVTRLIRMSLGDYNLNTLPPGMATEVPVKT